MPKLAHKPATPCIMQPLTTCLPAITLLPMLLLAEAACQWYLMHHITVAQLPSVCGMSMHPGPAELLEEVGN